MVAVEDYICLIRMKAMASRLRQIPVPFKYCFYKTGLLSGYFFTKK